jgi:hypothetical protein
MLNQLNPASNAGISRWRIRWGHSMASALRQAGPATKGSTTRFPHLVGAVPPKAPLGEGHSSGGKSENKEALASLRTEMLQ